MARAVLADGGYAVVGEAADAESALAAARELRPDCVLLDVQLGEADGFAVAEALAGERDAPGRRADLGPRSRATSSRSSRRAPRVGSSRRRDLSAVCAGGAAAVSFAAAPVATPQRARAFTARWPPPRSRRRRPGWSRLRTASAATDTRTLAAVTLLAGLSFVGERIGGVAPAPGCADRRADGRRRLLPCSPGRSRTSDSALPFTIGLGGRAAARGDRPQLILSFPEGRLHSRLERFVVAGAYFVVIVAQIVMLMFMGFEHVTGCPCPTTCCSFATTWHCTARS